MSMQNWIESDYSRTFGLSLLTVFFLGAVGWISNGIVGDTGPSDPLVAWTQWIGAAAAAVVAAKGILKVIPRIGARGQAELVAEKKELLDSAVKAGLTGDDLDRFLKKNGLTMP